MSYDLQLNEPGTQSPCVLDAPHQMKGGTYTVGGTDLARFNITYNYATILHRVLPKRVNSHSEFVGGDSLFVWDDWCRKRPSPSRIDGDVDR